MLVKYTSFLRDWLVACGYKSFVWLGAHAIGGPTAWLDVNIRSAAPLEETLIIVVELTAIDDRSGFPFFFLPFSRAF